MVSEAPQKGEERPAAPVAAPAPISGPGQGHHRGVSDEEIPFAPEWR